MKLEKALKSKALYYVALVLMVVNVLGYVSVGSVECIIVFAVTYYLSNSYTKNQSLDILIGLFVANVVFGCGRVREGFEEGAVGNAKKAGNANKKAASEEREKAANAQKAATGSPRCGGKGQPTCPAAHKALVKAGIYEKAGDAAHTSAALGEAAKKVK